MEGAVERCLVALSRALPDDRVLTDRDVCESHARDESEAEGSMPSAVIRARGAQDVVAVLTAAGAHGVPVTPRGAGTGRTGGAVPMRGGLVLACDRMRGDIDIDVRNGTAVVGPGVVTRDVHDAVEAEGLFWGPDPNSWAECTVGGNIAENAGGPRTFKYGATRDWVLGLEIVTGEGTRMDVGRRTRKGVTGYDLTSLVVGSEGTLAVVTRATLRLVPNPEAIVTMLVWLPEVASVPRAIDAVLALRVVPRCVEMLDDQTLDILRAASSLTVPAGARALLVLELDGTERAVAEDLERVGNALSAWTSFEVGVATVRADRERFWSVRRDMSRALRRQARWKISEDVVVPRTQLPALIDRCRLLSERHGIRMPAYGHAGDGNLHVNLLWDEPSQRPAVDAATAELFASAIELGGTLSGEHGIGALKAPFLGLEQSAAVIEAQRRIKDTFDPKGILNPGKIFPATGHGGC